MTATSQQRGHKIEFAPSSANWVYADTHQPTDQLDRPCTHCGQRATAEGHDACLGALPGVANACCGHGDAQLAYIQYINGTVKRGADAVEAFKETTQ